MLFSTAMVRIAYRNEKVKQNKKEIRKKIKEYQSQSDAALKTWHKANPIPDQKYDPE